MKNDEVVAHYAPVGDRSTGVIWIGQPVEVVVVELP
jgi:hypothetical protein